MSNEVRRVHITGGPGSGKTTVAKRIGSVLRIPVYHLDEMALDFEAMMPAREAFEALAAELPALCAAGAWISEGSYLGWATAMPESADLVIWMDTPGRTALYRILARHLKSELRRNNRFRGWRRLVQFLRWSARYYRNTNPKVLGFFGVPETREHAAELLKPYEAKLVVCRTNADIEAMLAQLKAVELAAD